jgi:8-oxo-dGTP diphosphatase
LSSRAYPERPFVGVGAVIVDETARVVLVKRRFEPLAGQWSLPGGAVDVGETLEACVVREMREETGLDVEVGRVIEVFDRITHDGEGRVQYHYVLVDYVCRPLGGTLAAASDVADVAWVAAEGLAAYRLTDKATAVVAQGIALAIEAGWAVRAGSAGGADEPSAASLRKGM